MRITGGRARGVPVRVEKGDRVRPATDRMREAIFSSLGPLVIDARVLDLFAGSGAYGLEALSRGARAATFIEKDKRSANLIELNLAATAKSMGLPRLDAKVIPTDVLNWHPSEAFDLIFIDPPYEMIAARARALFDLANRALVHGPDARVCFEHPGGRELSAPGWTCLRQLGGGSGQPTLSIFIRHAELTADEP